MVCSSLYSNRATKWMTCWPPTLARCWPPWASSGAHVATAGERLTGGRRLSWCACSEEWVSPAAGAGPSPGSCGGWAAVPRTARRTPFTLMIRFRPSPVRTTTSEWTWLDSVGRICSPPASVTLRIHSKMHVNSPKQVTSDLQRLPDFSSCKLVVVYVSTSWP